MGLFGKKKPKEPDIAKPDVGEMEQQRDVEGLVAALKGKDAGEGVRAAAAKALGEIGDAQAVEPLIAALTNDVGSVRIAASEALAQIGDSRAIEPLTANLSFPKAVRTAAVEALDTLGWTPDSGEAGAGYWIEKGQWTKCVEIGAPAVQPLIRRLGHLEPGLADIAAADALAKIGAPAVEPLIDALNYPDRRMRAADALGGIGDPRAVEPLIAALKYESSSVRANAAEALGKIGGPSVVEALAAALKDEDVVVRWAAENALRKRGDPRAQTPEESREAEYMRRWNPGS